MSTTFMQSVGLAAAMLASTSVFAADSEHIERGRYLATAGDCVACHTAPGGKPMAGGLALASPLGPIYSTNITPSKVHGIGNYTLEQFSDALRHGKRADGANLYPAMPYTEYAKTSDEDIAAMYAYFMQGVEAVDAAPAHTTALPFPFNIRASLGCGTPCSTTLRRTRPMPRKRRSGTVAPTCPKGWRTAPPATRHAQR